MWLNFAHQTIINIFLCNPESNQNSATTRSVWSCSIFFLALCSDKVLLHFWLQMTKLIFRILIKTATNKIKHTKKSCTEKPEVWSTFLTTGKIPKITKNIIQMSRRRKYRSFIYIFILFYATFQCPCHRDSKKNERKEKKCNFVVW